jgi:3-hydroxyisobutyrate dehydrogenase
MSNVAFIGLGVMGYPMAGHIARAGHRVCVYNRTTGKAEKWVEEFGGCCASTPARAAEDAEFIFTCVGNDDDLRAVILGENGAFQQAQSNAVFIDNTTASASVARELSAEAEKYNASFLDAPVSGGQSGAENGKLTVMIGGDAKAFKRARPVVECYAANIRLMGASGAGQLTKMVNQICIAGVIQGLAEGMHFARKLDLDVANVIDVISKGAARSWQMDNRWKTMDHGKYDFGFAVEWMRKDLGMILAEAGKMDIDLPLTSMVDEFYAEVEQMQNGAGRRWDTSSLLARLQEKT